MGRVTLAFKSFFGLLFGGALPPDVAAALGLARAQPVKAPRPAPALRAVDGAALMLALFQRDARLIDFLMEDIAPYNDEQVGAAVRDVHDGCRKTLERHLALEAVIDGVEGTPARPAAAGIDPADSQQVRFIGKVPPSGYAESGLLRHKGWKVKSADLPPATPGRDPIVLAPAEIEIE